LAAAFGSKEELFDRVVERYLAAQAKVIDAAMAKSDPVEIVRALMDGVATLLTSPRCAPGCLIMNNALPVTGAAPFRKRFADQREELRRRLEERLRATSAKALSSTPPLDASTISRLTLSIYWGMAVEAQSGASRREVRAIGEAFVQLLEVGARKRPRRQG